MTADRFVSYAQNLEDVMLWRALGAEVQGSGFYVDIGAADPTVLSVTRAFYARGWSGLNVEPLPEAAAKLSAERPRDVTVAAALADAPGRRRFHRVFRDAQTGLSTLDAAEAERQREAGAEVEPLDVPVTTLAALCREHVHGPVHFLKIDVEGAEAEVLAGADFRAVRPWILLVEATRPLSNEASGVEWEPGLLAAGYRFAWFDGLNRFYLAEEQAALARHFQAPPNVFDHYVQYDPMLQQHVAAVEQLVQTRLERIEALEAEIERLQQAAAVPPPEEPEPLPKAEPLPEPEPSLEPEPPPEPPPGREYPPPALPEPDPGLAAAPVRGWRRRLALSAYKLARPVLRPLAWRTRGFVTGDILRELAWIREQQDAMLRTQAATAHSLTVPAALSPSLPSANVMERFLLTMALEDAGNPHPHGLLDQPRPPDPAQELQASGTIASDAASVPP